MRLVLGPIVVLALVLALALALAPAASAHLLDSASLSLTETEGGRFLIAWQASSTAMQADLAHAVAFPPACHRRGLVLDCGTAGLVGTVSFPWIEGSTTRVVVDVAWRHGPRLLRIATPSAPRVRIYGTPTAGWRALVPIAADYTGLGIEHILTGFDHLLFVVALVLLVRGRAQLLGTITAFTVAHSLSLALTVLGLVRVPTPPVEACIALSIVLVCSECLRPGASLAHRAPWAVAFAFGLLHGLGFASALLALGVPERHVSVALFCFNVGVELGQLGVVAAVAGLRWAARRAHLVRGWMRPTLVYAMGGVAAYWSLDRLGAVLGR